MSRTQRFLVKVLPGSMAADMEAESRSWVLHCEPCGHDTSVWDMGGVRWKAAGNPRRRAHCSNCGSLTVGTLRRNA